MSDPTADPPSCSPTEEILQLMRDLASDDSGALRQALEGNRQSLIERLGDDIGSTLPADGAWSLPSAEECRIFVARYDNEELGGTRGESIQFFVADKRKDWV